MKIRQGKVFSEWYSGVKTDVLKIKTIQKAEKQKRYISGNGKNLNNNNNNNNNK